MTLSKLRTTSLLIAAATLCSNALSSLLFHQLPDDPYHIASNFSSYLYFANLVSILGLIGAFNQHAISISIFSNYLILDTILCAIPRILVLSMLSNIGAGFCEPDASDFVQNGRTPLSVQEIAMGGGIWLEKGQCSHLVFLTQAAMSAGVVAATLLQFIGALQVREYGRRLAAKELREGGIPRDDGNDAQEKEYSYCSDYEGGERGSIGDETSNVRI